MSQWSPVNPPLHSQIPVLPMHVPLPLHVVESSHTTKKVLCTLLRILQNYTLQTYSSFLDYLHHPCSNFREWQGHQFQSQCKGTVLDCWSLQNSSQQLIKSFIKECHHSILSIIKLVHTLKVLCILKQWFEKQVFHIKHVQTKTLIHLYIITGWKDNNSDIGSWYIYS